MKNLKNPVVLLFVAFVLVLSSCNKEKKIERRLTKKDGVWNIKTYESEYYYNGELEDYEIQADAGTFVFDDELVIITEKDELGNEYSFAGTWSNTDETLSVIIDGEVLTFEISDDSKDEMTLTYEESYTYEPGENYRDVIIFKLQREK